MFGPSNFRNEIVWKRKAGRGETNNAAIRFGVTTDSILFYAKGPAALFHRQYRKNKAAYIESKFTHVEPSGRRPRARRLRGGGAGTLTVPEHPRLLPRFP